MQPAPMRGAWLFLVGWCGWISDDAAFGQHVQVVCASLLDFSDALAINLLPRLARHCGRFEGLVTDPYFDPLTGRIGLFQLINSAPRRAYPDALTVGFTLRRVRITRQMDQPLATASSMINSRLG